MSAAPDPLAKLWTAARRVPRETAVSAELTPPPGFAGRVIAHRTANARAEWLTLWDRTARWGVAVAAAACVLVLFRHREQEVPAWDALVSAPSAELETWRP